MGFRRVVTYTLESEPGTSLRATGWVPAKLTKGGSWNTPSRPREDNAPTCRKIRWDYVHEGWRGPETVFFTPEDYLAHVLMEGFV